MNKIIIAIILATLVSGLAYNVLDQQAPLKTTLVYPKPKLLDNFELIDHQGQSFTQERLKGKWSIVFFGYTFCPDICPTTMTSLAQVANQLPDAKQLQIIFISVDPERDSIKRLAEYIAFFHPDFIALTATDEILQLFSHNVGAMYLKVATEDSYQMSHSGTLFLIDPEGQRYAIFSKSISGLLDVELITEDLKTIMELN